MSLSPPSILRWGQGPPWPMAGLKTSLRLAGWLPAAGGAVAIAFFLTLDATAGAGSGLLPAARVVETILPLAVGVHVAFLLSPEDEESLELLLACPRPLAWAVLERLVGVALLHGGVALLASAAAGWLAGPGPGWTRVPMLGPVGGSIARWLAPSILFGGAALVTTLFSRKGLLSALLISLLWGGLLLGGSALVHGLPFLQPLHPFLQPGEVPPLDYLRNRLSLALVGAVLLLLALHATADEEAMLGVPRPGNALAMAFADRWNLLWLPLAAGLFLLSSGPRAVPLAAWLAPIFMLRFVRRQPAGGAGPLLAYLAGVAALCVGWKEALWPRMGLGYLVFGLAYGLYLFLPYLIDRLFGRHSSFFATLIFPLACVILRFLSTLLIPAGALPGQGAPLAGTYGLTFGIAAFASGINWAWARAFRSHPGPAERTSRIGRHTS